MNCTGNSFINSIILMIGCNLFYCFNPYNFLFVVFNFSFFKRNKIQDVIYQRIAIKKPIKGY